MDFTFTLSKLYGVLPFRILEENADDVILLINYLNLKDEYDPTDGRADVTPAPKGKEERIKVNDKTATGGWW
jgi:hypothetical protein